MKVFLLFLLFVFLTATPAFAATITVNSTSDATNNSDGVCTLREAIIAANTDTISGFMGNECAAGSNTDTIIFSIPGAGPHVITPLTELPGITKTINIDGLSQPANGGASASCTAGPLLIAIDGSRGIDTGLYFNLGSDASFIRGLAVYNFLIGIRLSSTNNTVQCNFVGTDATGTAKGGNGNRRGLLVIGNNNLIGTDDNTILDANEGNLISGNYVSGIDLGSTTGSKVAGNAIGTNITKNGTIANDTGIVVEAGASGNVIGFDGAGTLAVESNVIRFNSTGIYVTDTGTKGNVISGNQITNQTTIGINLVYGTLPPPSPPLVDVVTPNDAGDADTGGNNLQNYPVLSSAVSSGGNTTVNYSLDSNPGTYRIEFFSNTTCSSTGNGEGETYLGSTTITLPGGAATAALPAAAVGQFITSTAIKQSGTGGTAGDTSEFSACRQVLAPTAATVAISGYVTTSLGRGITGINLSLTDSEGNTRTAVSTVGGYYEFTDVQVGETYILLATGKRFTFGRPVQVLNINEETVGVNFIADAEKRLRSF